MPYTFANHRFIFFVRNCRCFRRNSLKIVRSIIAVVKQCFQFFKRRFLIRLNNLDQSQLVIEMVKYYRVFVKNVKHVRRVVLCMMRLQNRNVLKITDCIKCGVTEQSANFFVSSFNRKAGQKSID